MSTLWGTAEEVGEGVGAMRADRYAPPVTVTIVSPPARYLVRLHDAPFAPPAMAMLLHLRYGGFWAGMLAVLADRVTGWRALAPGGVLGPLAGASTLSSRRRCEAMSVMWGDERFEMLHCGQLPC